jgi:hypothetical protein
VSQDGDVLVFGRVQRDVKADAAAVGEPIAVVVDDKYAATVMHVLSQAALWCICVDYASYEQKWAASDWAVRKEDVNASVVFATVDYKVSVCVRVCVLC